MITKDNEFGAPWNDQFYTIKYIFKLDVEFLTFTSDVNELIITLPGPKQYSDSEISKYALEEISKTYTFKEFYPETLIIKIDGK